MKAEQLRAALLQQAVQGKLVPQRDDEPAVEQIGDAPSDVPFMVPDKWKWAFFCDCMNVVRGGSPRPIKAYITDKKDGLNWIKIGDSCRGSKYIKSCKEKIIRDGLNKTRFVRKGSLVLTNSMSYGYPYILDVDGCIHDGWLALSGFEQVFEKEFLYYFLLSPTCRTFFVNIAAGAVVKNLNTKKVLALPIVVPPLAEQRRIIARLNELLPMVDAYGKEQEALEKIETALPDQLRASLLQGAVQGKLVPQRDDEPTVEQIGDALEDVPFAIPEKWKWIRLNDLVVSNIGGGTPDKSNPQYWGGKIRWASVKDMVGDELSTTRDSITDLGLNNSTSNLIPVGSVILCVRMAVGRIAINSIPVAINQDLRAIRLNEQYVDKEYFLMAYKTLDINATGTTVKGIRVKELLNLPIPIPSLAEQRRIVARLKELLPMVDKLAARAVA